MGPHWKLRKLESFVDRSPGVLVISRGRRPEARNAGYLLLLSKTSLQALEPKYNSKTEFGIKKSSSFIAFQGKAAAAAPPPLQNVLACLEEGLWGLIGKLRI